MIILGNFGVASRDLINCFLDKWWQLDISSYNRYFKRFKIKGKRAIQGEAMVKALKDDEPSIYQFILIELEKNYLEKGYL